MYIHSTQLPEHSVLASLVLELVLSFLTRSSAAQVIASYWNVPVIQLPPMTVFILLMLVLAVKVTSRQNPFCIYITFTQLSHTQLHVQLVSYDLWEEALNMKAELRSASTVNGALCVMTPGAVLMPL